MATTDRDEKDKDETPPVILQCYSNAVRYMEMLEQTASFNSKLSNERKMRLPFLDSQTGVAQRHTQLLHPYRHRQPGSMSGQLYTYPAKQWKKKKKSFFSQDPRLGRLGDGDTGDAGFRSHDVGSHDWKSGLMRTGRSQRAVVAVQRIDMHQISAIENPAHRGDDHLDYDHLDASAAHHGGWYDDLDDPEPPDLPVSDDPSYVSDFEDERRGRRKRKAPTKSRRKKKEEDKDLATEDKSNTGEVRRKKESTPRGKRSNRSETSAREAKAKPGPPPPAPLTPSAPSSEGKISANDYCDFCLGYLTENKKTNATEELVSCSDCGRSGHPTCLQFTDNMIVSVKKYPWQCIECKTCGLCGTSDNDDQMLFCDDCDRGYHMYCLKPPLTEPPEGSWSCHLCIEEFHAGKKPAGMN